MRAVVLRVPGTGPAVEEVELDEPHAGEVRVRVEAAGVCGTELHYLDGDLTCPLPVVLGHEGVGVVEQVGPGVDRLRPGDRVCFTWRPRCGQCEACVTGRPVMCRYGRVQARSGGLMDGTSRLHAGGEDLHHLLGVSCFAEQVVVSQRAVVAITPDVPAAVAAVVGCAVVTGVGAVVNAAAAQTTLAGRPVVVVGAGGVGLSAVMGARLVGAGPVVAVDVTAARLELARRLGATHTVDTSALSPEAAVEAVRDATGGGAEVAVEAVGRPQTLRLAFDALRPGGTVVAAGLSGSTNTVTLPLNELVQQQKRVVGSLYGSANPPVDLPRLLALYTAGRLPLDALLGRAHPLEDAAAALRALRDATAVGRAVLVPAPA